MKINDINLSNLGTEVTVRQTEVQAKSVLKKLDSVYDEHAKLVFLFDCSTSMAAHIAKTYTDQYIWTPEILTAIRDRVADAVKRTNEMLCDPMYALNVLAGVAAPLEQPDDESLLKLTDDRRGPNGELQFNPTDDEDLKERVVRHDLIGFFNIGVDFTKTHEKPLTRMELVKKLAKSELQNRFNKFPKSRIAVIPFGNDARVLFDDGAPEALWPELENLAMMMVVNGISVGGGTDILDAISQGVKVCTAKPSPVGVHHFVLVSDGEDYAADRTIESWVPNLKASGVVFDYIHIGDRMLGEGLSNACKALGGECVVVNSEKAFTEKFVAAVTRKMLPPAVSV